MNYLLELLVPALVVGAVVVSDFIGYVCTRRDERRRLDEWTADARRQQDEAFESWRLRKTQAREFASRRSS